MATNPATRSPRISRRRLGRLALGAAGAAAVGPLVLTACRGRDNSVVVVYGNTVTTLDPQRDGGTVLESINRNIYECLVRRSPDMKTLEPCLATSWSQLDERTMQFKLRQGVKFQNDEDFTGDAVKFTMERALDPNIKAPYRSTFLTIEKVDVVDKYTVNVVTKGPDPLLLARLSIFHSAVVPPGYFKSAGDQDLATKPSGTGPYRLASWVRDGDLTLEANPDYWGPKPKVPKVIIRGLKEDASRVAALRAGEADIVTGVPPSEIASIETSGKGTVKGVPSLRNPYYHLRTDRDPTSNVKVRQAINYGTDMDGIIKSVLDGKATRIATMLNPLYFGFDPDLKPYPYDPDRARKLLAEAGYANGIDINMDTQQGRYMRDKEIAEAIVGSLAKVNIRVKMSLWENAVFSEKNNADQLGQMVFGSWAYPLMDADGVLWPHFHSSQHKRTNRSDYTYGNPAVDKLLDQAQTTVEPQKRLDLYKQAQKIIFDDAPHLFMFELQDLYGVSKRLNWTPRSDEMIWLSEASFA